MSNMQIAYGFAQCMNMINKWWVILDTASTASVVCNEDLVTNLRDCVSGEELKIITNGGSKDFNKIGDLKLLPM